MGLRSMDAVPAGQKLKGYEGREVSLFLRMKTGIRRNLKVSRLWVSAFLGVFLRFLWDDATFPVLA